jgi:thioredoxin-dependent peroxiredoxin
MAEIRKDAVTMKGNPLDLVGPKLKPGDKAPDFHCVTVQDGLKVLTLADTGKKARLFSVVPSLDTPVCNRQTKHFASVLKELGDKIAAFTISTDLPFAMARFCSAETIDNLKNLSDLHDQSFGEHYGVKIQGLPVPLLARAIFVVDPSDMITYVEYVPEIATEPDYEPALKALSAAAKA